VITEFLAERIVVGDSRPAFEFHTTGSSSWPIWDRFITFEKNLKFHIGNVCNTCDFFFTRVSDGVLESESSARIAGLLNAGDVRLNDISISEITSFLPSGPYYAAVSVGVPEFVRPGGTRDFFSHEQFELRKAAEPPMFSEPPHVPATDYYRLETRPLGDGRVLYEFVVPTIPPDNLETETVGRYRGREEHGTALAVSVLDVKRPAFYEDDVIPDVTEHWTLTHYLLDGNHKTRAASLENRPISILCLIAVAHGVSSEDQITAALGALRRP
jgi:hypothetical protein